MEFKTDEHAKEWLTEYEGAVVEYAHCFNVVRDALFGAFDSNTQVNPHALPVINSITQQLIYNTDNIIEDRYPEDYKVKN